MPENRVVDYVSECYKTFKEQRRDLEDIWLLAYDSFLGRYSQSNLDRWKALEGHDWRSKVFIRFARRKVLSSVAQINDIYFQGGAMPFDITPSPMASGMGMMLPPKEADSRARAMKEQISDDLSKQKYERLLMASNLEMSIYGMSVHKAPVLRPKRSITYQFQTPQMAGWLPNPIQQLLASKFGRHTPVESMEYLPTVEHVNLWDYFWDMEGQDHESGTGNIQRVMMDIGMLRRLEELPGYDSQKISEAVTTYYNAESNAVGAGSNEGPSRNRISQRRRGIEVVEFRGRIPRKYLENTHQETFDAVKDIDGREVEIITVIAFAQGEGGGNGIEIFPAVPNPMPLQKRGFHVAYWERMPHETEGVGLCENVQDSQIMQNGFWRCFIDNSALSSNLLRFYKSGAFKAGQDMNLRPGAGYELEDWVKDVREAVQWVAPPYIGGQMIDALNVSERLGDEESGHPKILQGERAKYTPKTATENMQLVEAANKQVGQIIKNIDEGHIEPDVEALYHYHMMTSPDEGMKVAAEFNATGFAAYNDKIRKGQAVQQLFALFAASPLTAKFVKIPDNMRELYRLRDLDPDKLMMSEQEVEQAMNQEAAMMAAQAGLQAPPGMQPPGMPPGMESGMPPDMGAPSGPPGGGNPMMGGPIG